MVGVLELSNTSKTLHPYAKLSASWLYSAAREPHNRGIHGRHGKENDLGKADEDVHETDGHAREQPTRHLHHHMGTVQLHDTV
jgi:hypothetical protein